MGVVSTKMPFKGPIKGPSAYNLFCKGKKLDYTSSGTTFLNWSEQWRSLDVQEKEKFHRQANDARRDGVEAADTKMLMKKHLKLISQSCDILGSVGVHIGGNFVDAEGKPGAFGSQQAHGYFTQYDVQNNFALQMIGPESSKPQLTADLDHKRHVQDVRKLFNDLWEKATGKPKVPYKAIKDGKFLIHVKNLPDGIGFRDPSCMGLKALIRIMSAKDIEIQIISDQLENELDTVEISQENPETTNSPVTPVVVTLSSDNVDDILMGDFTVAPASTTEVAIEPTSSKLCEVERVLKKRNRRKKRELLVKWKYQEDPTWELEANLV